MVDPHVYRANIAFKFPLTKTTSHKQHMERKNLKWVVTNKSKNRKGHLISGASCHTKLVWTNSNYKNYCSRKTASKRDYMQDTAIAPETTSLHIYYAVIYIPQVCTWSTTMDG